MPWTTPRTWTNAAVTATDMNTYVRNNQLWLKAALTLLNVTSDTARAKITPALCGARAYHNAAQSTTTSVGLALSLNSERYDSDAFHSTSVNTNRMTIPTGMDGYYVFGGNVEWAANGTGSRVVDIRVNATNVVASQRNTPGAAVTFPQNLMGMSQLAAADYLDMAVFQNSGGNLNVNSTSSYSPELWLHRMSST